MRSAGLQIGSSIRYEKDLYGNYFLNCYIVKMILISFNCFSEYRPALQRELLRNNSLYVGQLYEDKSLAIRTRDLIFFTNSELLLKNSLLEPICFLKNDSVMSDKEDHSGSAV